MDLYRVLDDLNHVDDLIRQAAYVHLLDQGDVWMEDLLDEFPGIEGGARLSVIRAFGEIGDERAVPLLLEAMTDRSPDSYFMTPSFAARALSRIGGERTLNGLRDHLEEGEPTVRRMATMVLGHIGGDEAIDVLRFALVDDDPKVRAIAVEALKKIDTPRAHALIYASRDLM